MKKRSFKYKKALGITLALAVFLGGIGVVQRILDNHTSDFEDESVVKVEENKALSEIVGPQVEVPTIAQLNLYSETAMLVNVKGIQFIIGDEIPILQIIKNDEVVTDYIEVGDTDEIYDIADLERYAIKWYYKNELGIDF